MRGVQITSNTTQNDANWKVLQYLPSAANTIRTVASSRTHPQSKKVHNFPIPLGTRGDWHGKRIGFMFCDSIWFNYLAVSTSESSQRATNAEMWRATRCGFLGEKYSTNMIPGIFMALHQEMKFFIYIILHLHYTPDPFFIPPVISYCIMLIFVQRRACVRTHRTAL